MQDNLRIFPSSEAKLYCGRPCSPHVRNIGQSPLASFSVWASLTLIGSRKTCVWDGLNLHHRPPLPDFRDNGRSSSSLLLLRFLLLPGLLRHCIAAPPPSSGPGEKDFPVNDLRLPFLDGGGRGGVWKGEEEERKGGKAASQTWEGGMGEEEKGQRSVCVQEERLEG